MTSISQKEYVLSKLKHHWLLYFFWNPFKSLITTYFN